MSKKLSGIAAALMTLAISAVFLSTAAFTQSDDASKDKSGTADITATLFGRFGFSSNPDISPSLCKVDMQLKQATFIQHIDELKVIGLLNPDITRTQANLMPNTLSMVFAMEMIVVATKEIYDKNNNTDRCEFIQKIVMTNDYGNDETLLMFSYWFTRALYKKINWDNFLTQNMPKVAQNFQVNPEFQAMVIRETNLR